MMSECVDTVFVDHEYKSKLACRHTAKCTLRQCVVTIGNPETGRCLKFNALQDTCCAHTQCDIRVAQMLGVTGKKIDNITIGAGGKIHRSKGILATVQIGDLTGTTSVTFPIRFIEKPAGNIPFFDWRDCQNKFDFLRDIPLPEPVYHEGLPSNTINYWY